MLFTGFPLFEICIRKRPVSTFEKYLVYLRTLFHDSYFIRHPREVCVWDVDLKRMRMIGMMWQCFPLHSLTSRFVKKKKASRHVLAYNRARGTLMRWAGIVCVCVSVDTKCIISCPILSLVHSKQTDL